MSRSNEFMRKVDKALGVLIYNARINAGWSRQQLGDLIDVTHQQVQKYEAGSNRIAVARVIMLADAFKLPVSHFYKACDHMSVNQDLNEERTGCRLKLELVRNFNKINDKKAKENIVALTRTLSGQRG